MFSHFPPVIRIDKNRAPKNMIKVFSMDHTTTSSKEYISEGIRRQDQTHCIFHYTVRGRGEVIYKNKSYFTREKEGFFNVINDAESGYRYPQDGTGEWEFIVLCFEGPGVREVVSELLENQVVYDLSQTEKKFCEICEELLSYTENNADFMAFPKLIALLKANVNTDFVKNFENAVARHLEENPTILSIADKLNISREHLQREYKRLTDTSPARYISSKRFEHLLYLLSSTNLSQERIAERMNFSSKSAMEQFFKKWSGTTVQKYRKTGYIAK